MAADGTASSGREALVPTYDGRVRRDDIPFAAVAVVGLTLAFVIHARGEWVWDDVELVQQNPRLAPGSGLWPLLTHDLGNVQGTHIYRPVPLALQWIETRIFGVSLLPMRCVNVLVHAVNGVLLLLVMRREGATKLAAQVGALVFLLHPASTEPVMWISGLHDLLGVTMTLAACLASRRAWLAGVFTALAVLSKEAYAVVPLLLALLVLGLRRARDVRVLGASFAAVLLVFVLRWRLGMASGGGRTAGGVVDYATVFLHYALGLFTFTNARSTETYEPVAASVVALVVVVAAAAVLVRSKNARLRALSFGMVWIAIALAPYAIAVPVARMYGNRYAYLALVGFALAVGYAVDALASWLRSREPTARVGGVVERAAPVLALPLAIATAADASLWKSGMTLFGADFDRAPNDPRALYHFGHANYRVAGCKAALPFYQRAVEIEPTYQRAWHNVAGCLINEHAFAEAVEPARTELGLAPDDPRAEYNLGLALVSSGQRDEGIAHLERSVALDPSWPTAAETLRNARK